MSHKQEDEQYDISQLTESFQLQIQKKLEVQQESVDKLEAKSKECQRVADLVDNLLKKPHHQVMVPLGKFAFLPGELIHTNDYMVKLGQDTLVHRSASQTVEILNRRKSKLDKQRLETEEQMSKLKQKLQDFLQLTGEEGLIDIQETYDEAIHGSVENTSGGAEAPTLQKQSKDDKGEELITEDDFMKLMTRIEELEVLENEQEQQRNQTAKGRIEGVIQNQKEGIEQNGNHSTPFVQQRPPIPKPPSSQQKKQTDKPPESSPFTSEGSQSSTPPQKSKIENINQEPGNNREKSHDNKIPQPKKQSSKTWTTKEKQKGEQQQGQQQKSKHTGRGSSGRGGGGFKKGFLAHQPNSQEKPKQQGGFSGSVVEHKPSIHTVSEPVDNELEKQQRVKNMAARWEVSPDSNDQQSQQQNQTDQKQKKQSRFKQMMQESKS